MSIYGFLIEGKKKKIKKYSGENQTLIPSSHIEAGTNKRLTS